jgi:predicted SnoaL-like aldol condensation-catalyzing enzyme
MTPNKNIYMTYQDALIAVDRAVALREVLRADVVDHAHTAGLAGIIALREQMGRLLPDETRHVRMMHEIGDLVTGYLTSSATDPRTGESFTVGLLDTIRLDGGKVAERWVALDDPEGKIRTVVSESPQ